jgi:hypothetical protein
VSGVYLAASAVEALEQAQAELYEHLLADAGGRCTSCGEREPCSRRNALNATILDYGQLPKRRPGRTKAGLRRKVVPAA